MTSNRTQFLRRIKQSLGHSPDALAPSPAAAPPRPDALLRQVSPADPHLTDRWIRLAQTNGMHVQKTSPASLFDLLTQTLRQHHAQSILLNLAAPDSFPTLHPHLENAGNTVHQWGNPNSREFAFHADASITDCRYALADTGSLLVWSDSRFGRSSTLTVPLHIVLLPESRILPDLIDALPRIPPDTANHLPSNIVLINGPSKTADIEMNLVTGVHGPKHLHVIVITASMPNAIVLPHS